MRHRTIGHPVASGRNGGEIGFGAVGCGGFGLFALHQLVQVPGLDLVAVTDVSGQAMARARDEFGADAAPDLDALLARDDVDAVYIATPPYLHHDQAMRALAAGKHVICEPPPAVTVGDGEQLLTEARRRDRLLVTDFLRRYDPLFAAIASLLPAGALGQFLHGSFENLGSAEDLPPDHWFWDRALSGGIFVEHGVEFFDLFAGWLGTGRVQAARIGVRSGSSIEEQVDCAVRYDGGGWVSFYHGFRQGSHTDRQTLKLFFELGDVTLLNWTPTRVRMHALVSESQARAVADMFPGAQLDLVETYAAPHREYWSRREEQDADHIPDTAGGAVVKTRRYAELLRAMFTDQTAWIRDHDHPRRVTEADGYDALVTAHEADRLAGLAGLAGGDQLTSV
ncbi:putative dehydrogenase [Catenulispora sp. GP43]|uniref:Gfo/Idh/MocA family protein n=1 Tax=Catenulispora sp. GP43 TaxID=3156263 RepID=UPI00351315DB